jgi:prepilin-type N-terminal cleavage/methylation domain-containing protein/prepilin-type processing-associated H-X9-DG protein
MRSGRSGFTLIELLVVTSILAILIGLTLPAIQQSREAARRSQCASKLHQVMLAVQGFEASHATFPPATINYLPYKGPLGPNSFFSLHAALLPHVEATPLYNEINFFTNCHVFAHLDVENRTAAGRVVEAFVCPSDPGRRPAPYGPCSYRACLGVVAWRRTGVRVFEPVGDGAFAYGHRVRASEFGDGLSHTVAFSEKPLGSTDGGYHPFRDYAAVRRDGGDTSDVWIGLCSALTRPSEVHRDAGRTWLLSGAGYTVFWASVPPNSPIPDCGMSENPNDGIFAARSYHPGVVNAAMADGSVRAVSGSISADVWRALATRASGEPVALD